MHRRLFPSFYLHPSCLFCCSNILYCNLTTISRMRKNWSLEQCFRHISRFPHNNVIIPLRLIRYIVVLLRIEKQLQKSRNWSLRQYFRHHLMSSQNNVTAYILKVNLLYFIVLLVLENYFQRSGYQFLGQCFRHALEVLESLLYAYRCNLLCHSHC